MLGELEQAGQAKVRRSRVEEHVGRQGVGPCGPTPLPTLRRFFNRSNHLTTVHNDAKRAALFEARVLRGLTPPRAGGAGAGGAGKGQVQQGGRAWG